MLKAGWQALAQSVDRTDPFVNWKGLEVGFVFVGEVVGVFGRQRSEKCSERLVADYLAVEIADVFRSSAVLEI